MSAVVEKEPMAYVGYCPTCGALCAAAVDTPERKRDTGKFVGQLIRDGLRVAQMTCPDVRAAEWCKCDRPSRKRTSRPAQQHSLPLSGTT